MCIFATGVCFRCGEKGHQVRECHGHMDRWDEESNRVICRRCGRKTCRAAHDTDLLRAEGECDSDYYKEDLSLIECLSCGGIGHSSCTDLAETSPKASCYNCGEGGHIGTECKKDPTPPVRSERRRVGRQRDRGSNINVHRMGEEYQQRSRHSWPMTSSSDRARYAPLHPNARSSAGFNLWGNTSRNNNKYTRDNSTSGWGRPKDRRPANHSQGWSASSGKRPYHER